jgi:hypothetical protein
VAGPVDCQTEEIDDSHPTEPCPPVLRTIRRRKISIDEPVAKPDVEEWCHIKEVKAEEPKQGNWIEEISPLVVEKMDGVEAAQKTAREQWNDEPVQEG